MGKKGTWFSAVKKAFRSPSKDKDSTKNVGKDLDPIGELATFEVPVSSPALYPPAPLLHGEGMAEAHPLVFCKE